ncbi:MAG: NAD-dependent epimerase/dehydratase family protein [Deltaproteobacteria bacterium]|nr:NAD-dependent epimerase/dehydratase family protein [Deltaproteobacteria bacterium]
MKALVTGSNGFIGSHLIELLQDRGDTAYAMVRKTSNVDNLAGRTVDYRYAGLTDPDSLTEAMKDVDVVYHLAGMTAGRGVQDFERVNGGGTANVMAAAKAAGVEKVVYVSSLAAAGPSHHDVPRSEHHTPSPVSIYGRSKYSGEKAAHDAAQDGKLHVTIVRPPVVYGPRDDDFLQVIQMAKSGLILKLGFHDAWFSAVHPHDLTRGILLAGAKGKSIPVDDAHALVGGGLAHDVAHDGHHEAGEGVYFVTDGGQYTWAGLGQKSAEALGKKGFVVTFPVPLAYTAAWFSEMFGKVTGKLPIFNRDKVREGAASGWWASIDKANAELGFTPEMDFERGIEDTIRWAKDNKRL